MKVAIIGKGHVASAIAKGLEGRHEVKFGHRDPKEPVARAAKWCEILFVAVPYPAVPEVARDIGSAADGKTVVDVTNAIAANGELEVGFSTSAAEEFKSCFPKLMW
jgi:8-hydroxy-5-deazaflavin:NADPH oxidoreductase